MKVIMNRVEKLQDIPLDLSRSFDTLSILDLEFSQTQISNASILSLFGNISLLTNLNQLRLIFKECQNIKSVGLNVLNSSASLRKLRISLAENPNRIKEGFSELCRTLQHLEHAHVSLNLDYCFIEPDHVMSLQTLFERKRRWYLSVRHPE
eukprot:TRINITY_DN13565_c0_g2_i3.p2 TRINITY_DN13565_c0_g2~~TRINITY_DN13565_c0_g2_i3.p2  ORF type:complete len:151 (+),score=4.68 TRINITY_DN13565_c0_g2_i3:893-1345(+)